MAIVDPAHEATASFDQVSYSGSALRSATATLLKHTLYLSLTNRDTVIHAAFVRTGLGEHVVRAALSY